MTDAVFTPEPSETKLARMRADMEAAGFDARAPSLGHFALSPVARAMYDLELRQNRLLDEAFVVTASRPQLEKRGADLRLPPLTATPATGTLLFRGTTGTVVPAGFVVRSYAAAGGSVVEATTDLDVTLSNVIDVGIATGTVTATVRTAGIVGNVTPDALIRPDPLAGLVSVTNPAAFDGGTDDEATEAYRARLLDRLGNPSSSGNRADYVKWARAVPGVGGVSAVGNPFGPGTVGIYVIGTDGLPADQTVIDAVLQYVGDVFRSSVEAETLAVSGSGVTGAALPTGAAGLRLAYNAAADGLAQDTAIQTTRLIDPEAVVSINIDPGVPGIWRVIPYIMATGALAGAPVSLSISAQNDTTAVVASTAPSTTGDSSRSLVGTDYLTAAPVPVPFDVYYDGRSSLSFRIRRLNTVASAGPVVDTATVWYVDRIEYRSAFTPAAGDGLAPVGARVYVFPAAALIVTVRATLVVSPDRDPLVVAAAARVRVAAYLASLAFASERTVRYHKLADVLAETPGVSDIAADPTNPSRSSLFVNGGQANVPVGSTAVALFDSTSIISAVVGG